MLEIKNLSKTYGTKVAVNNLSFLVENGDIMGFIGKNGAGKTTTLKSCLGIIGIDNGEILLDGVSLMENPIACKKKMAYVPDNPRLDEYMTGVQYLNFVCDIYEVSRKERIQSIDRLSGVFQMKKHLSNLVSSYSYGMKQKLALMAAFSHVPKLLILDEPFVGLDPDAFITLKEQMRLLCDSGSSVLFSSHILDVVEKVCNKVSVIKNGMLLFTGLTSDLIGSKGLEEVFMEVNKDNENAVDLLEK
ncbi:ABC transporter related protein [Ruminiclostridium papyrosolvens DSM 2782]|uniref:ABC transporter related protein n=1 Tax=Ruminiclostridium papyrosolvens DSM 2782 TaxID=588581 RepID=F1TFZ0_9FIRM|nr:ABC transporter ATP-binding protein [Ruminiclostridium papyrosolvens]EGD46609.1 ABC transporter related protein [Ruminiclostridium papyrosolvens DSM 2782]WES35758.1 ABC transporter ATP-binding protein [Ruminiclostridium papyrosolvens DSM 2782]